METQNSDWKLFSSLLVTQEQLGADWQGGLEVSLITASQVWNLLVGTECSHAVPSSENNLLSSIVKHLLLKADTTCIEMSALMLIYS